MTKDHDLIGHTFPVLDNGSVTLTDYMGSDADIANAARVSYGKGTRKVSEDRDLIRYLWRNHHTSPFEMAEIKLHVRVPMDVTRQWWRHRTASINEVSTRYSEAIDAAQVTPSDGWRLQAKDNKQGSAGIVTEWPNGYQLSEDHEKFDDDDTPISDGPMVIRTDPETGADRGFRVFQDDETPTPGGYLTVLETELHDHARSVYEERLAFGVAREQARKDLPLSTMTEAIWKCDLRNVLGFLAQRMDGHAQQEIREYANVIGNEIVAKLFPITWDAFCTYTLNAMTLTALDIQAIRCAMAGGSPATLFANDRERKECREKLERLGLGW